MARHEDRYPPKLRALLLEGGRSLPKTWTGFRNTGAALTVSLSSLLDEVDLVLSPSAEGAAHRGLAITGDPRFSLLWTYTGCPTVNLPAALSPEGLPLGLQLSARPMADTALLATARKVEALLGFDARPG